MIFLDDKNLNQEKYQKYTKLVMEQNKKSNITGFKNFDDFMNIGIYETIKPYQELVNKGKIVSFKSLKILDVGSGSGLPSIPLLILSNNNFDLTIIESNQKKCLFLKSLKKELGLSFTIINKRVEELKSDHLNYFDFIICRAFAPIDRTLYLTSHLLKNNGFWLLYKGQNFKKELAKINLNNFPKDLILTDELQKKCIETYNFKDIETVLVKIQKNKTPNGWPLTNKEILRITK